jgi:hypothetical protein
MTDHVARLYALAVAILVFLLAWAAVAARPWATSSQARPDPRVQALIVKQERVRREALAVRRVLASRSRQAAAPASTAPAPAQPSVRIVTLPPLTVTRTS